MEVNEVRLKAYLGLKDKMKKYTLIYHRRSDRGKNAFNNMWTTIDANDSKVAVKKARTKLGARYVIEKAMRK